MRVEQISAGAEAGPILTTTGDLLVRGAVNLERLPAGAVGAPLTGQGAGVVPAYTAPPILPFCKAYLSADQSIPRVTWTKAALDLTVFDTTNDWDAVNHRYVVSVAGNYIVFNNVFILILEDTKAFMMTIYVNGANYSSYQQLIQGGTGGACVGGGDAFPLAVDDFVELYVRHGAVGNRSIKGGGTNVNYLTLYKVP